MATLAAVGVSSDCNGSEDDRGGRGDQSSSMGAAGEARQGSLRYHMSGGRGMGKHSNS